jgi:hypothetical protein
MRMMAALVGVVLAATAACGGNGNGDDTASGRAFEQEAQQRARSIVLTLADFPNDWRGSAPEPDDNSRDKFNKCIGVDYSQLTRIGEAESQDFSKGDSTEATSNVVIFKDDQQAEDAMSEHAEGMGGTATEDCVQDLVEEALRKGGSTGRFKLGEIDVGELNFTPPTVDEAKAWQIVIPVEITSGVGKGFEPDVYLELVTLRQGDTVAVLSTQDVLTEFDRDLRDKLVQAMAGRMSESST